MSPTLPLPLGGEVTISTAVLGTMCGFAQRRQRDKEAGGMLIGHHPLNTENIIFDRLTTPQPEDRRSRCRFERDQAAHQRLLDHEWVLSGGKRTYLGEWHTHPEACPSPSPLDRRSWSAALRETAFHGPGLLFIIVGTEMIRIWFGAAQNHDIHLLGERAVSEPAASAKGAVT